MIINLLEMAAGFQAQYQPQECITFSVKYAPDLTFYFTPSNTGDIIISCGGTVLYAGPILGLLTLSADGQALLDQIQAKDKGEIQ